MTKSPFIHLRVYTPYSLLAGTVDIDDLVEKCVKERIPAVGISDLGNLFGSLEFSLATQKAGIQPIIGEVFKFDPQLEADPKEQDDIFIIAKNKIGYQNLLKLSSQYYTSGKRYMTLDELIARKDGLIVLTCNKDGTVGKLLLNKKPEKAEEFLLRLNDAFKDNLYIELMRHGFPEEDQIEPALIELGLKHNIPFVATNHVYFLNKDMFEAHDALCAIADSSFIVEQNRTKSSEQYYFKSASEMRKLFEDVPEAITNTATIAQRCSVASERRDIMFPKFEIEGDLTEAQELERLARLGLSRKLASISSDNHQEYLDRLDYELGVINKMNFPGYFLIVSDFIRWAKSKGIPVGPGRGSGVGSIVSWTMDITDIDPLKFGLLFERFLNPERISLPDLDIDFCQDRRDEVINYVRNKYGQTKVASIITFGKLQAKAVIKDVGRVMQLPYPVVDRIAKMIPFNAINPVTLAQAIKLEPEMQKAMKEDPKIAKLIQISLQLEGLNRHASTHATGIVIADRDIDTFVPLYQDVESSAPAIQYSMKPAEAAGLIKFDFLGLRTLTVIAKCEELIKQINPTFSINNISIEDKKTFEMLSLGRAVGVFQFESPGMRAALNKMKPDSIEDIIALGALYRPGPMENIPRYIECKHGKAQPDYIHPKLEGLLKKTFGIIIYQEQVIEIAKILAGYTLGQADLLRRAMGKKIKEEMDAQREMFVKGALDNGLDKEQAVHIFDLVAKFAGYGFNRSHAVAYGIISYQTAYLKANYPTQMIASLMNSEIDDTDKLNAFVFEARDIGVEVGIPDINLSRECFTVLGERVIYALGAVKTVSIDAMKCVCVERDARGPFKDIFDFMARCKMHINKRQLEHLIKAGAFDSIAPNRRQLFESIDHLFAYNPQGSHTAQLSLFNMTEVKPHLAEVEDWSTQEKLTLEFSAIGFYLSSHPLAQYAEYFKLLKIMDAAQIRNNLANGVCSVKVAAIPVVIKNRSSPRGRFLLTSMSTASGMLDITIASDQVLEACRDSLYSKMPLLIEADVRKDDNTERITASRISRLDEYLSKQTTNLAISIKDEDTLDSIKQVIVHQSTEIGNFAITLRVKAESYDVLIELPQGYRLQNDSVHISTVAQNMLMTS